MSWKMHASHAASDDGRSCVRCGVVAREFAATLPCYIGQKCTCLSISRDPMCPFHGDMDKVLKAPKTSTGTSYDDAMAIVCGIVQSQMVWHSNRTLALDLHKAINALHCCPKCGEPMAYTATAPIVGAELEWRCFECPVDLGSVSTNAGERHE